MKETQDEGKKNIENGDDWSRVKAAADGGAIMMLCGRSLIPIT